ncbi:MAG: hypothetical protein JSY10_29470 [Paenibacillus sp.]|nr:hypothetical protein [Paenibacillus sp.]
MKKKKTIASTATTENPTIKQRRVVPLSFHDFPAFKGGYITVTTFHRLPLIGFSLSKTNSSRKTSMFFSAIAKCIAKKNGNFEMKKLDKLIKVNIKNQDLDPILASLEEKMKDSKEGGICIIDFLSQQKGLSKLAQSLSGPISTAKKKKKKKNKPTLLLFLSPPLPFFPLIIIIPTLVYITYSNKYEGN